VVDDVVGKPWNARALRQRLRDLAGVAARNP
jgi:hypothetical protein